MNKVKSNALWNGLTIDQRNALDKWLVEEKLSYDAVFQKAQTQLRYTGSKSSLIRYFYRQRKERITKEFKDLRDEMLAVSDAPADAASARQASMKLLAAFLFQQLRNSPEKVKEWAAVASLIVQNDYNETMREEHQLRRELKERDEKVRRELKAEDQKLRREMMAFAKEKHEFDMTEQAFKALPQLLELREAKKDPQTKRYEENMHWNRARRAMFGPGCEVHPESAEEEAAMIAAKKEREERKAKQAQMEREKLKEAQPPPPMNKYYPEYLEKLAKKAQENWEKCPMYEI